MSGPLRVVSRWRLTGVCRHRRNWRGKLILQVEKVRHHGYVAPERWTGEERRWFDATDRDLDVVQNLFVPDARE